MRENEINRQDTVKWSAGQSRRFRHQNSPNVGIDSIKTLAADLEVKPRMHAVVRFIHIKMRIEMPGSSQVAPLACNLMISVKMKIDFGLSEQLVATPNGLLRIRDILLNGDR